MYVLKWVATYFSSRDDNVGGLLLLLVLSELLHLPHSRELLIAERLLPNRKQPHRRELVIAERLLPKQEKSVSAAAKAKKISVFYTGILAIAPCAPWFSNAACVFACL